MIRLLAAGLCAISVMPLTARAAPVTDADTGCVAGRLSTAEMMRLGSRALEGTPVTRTTDMEFERAVKDCAKARGWSEDEEYQGWLYSWSDLIQRQAKQTALSAVGTRGITRIDAALPTIQLGMTSWGAWRTGIEPAIQVERRNLDNRLRKLGFASRTLPALRDYVKASLEVRFIRDQWNQVRANGGVKPAE